MSNLVYLGAEDPEALEVTVTPGNTGIDLTTVTASVLKVKGPTGPVMSWTVVPSAVSASSMKLTHIFTAADLEAGAGRYAVVAELTIGGKTRRCLMQPLRAVDIFD